MQIAFFDAHPFEVEKFNQLNTTYGFTINYIASRLTAETAKLANGSQVVCAFVSDILDAKVLDILKTGGIELITLRSAGFNHVDLTRAKELGLRIVRVPEYSPYSVAEHTVALMMTLNRKTHRTFNRVRDGNFSLDGLVGFDVHGKTFGILGTGKIGSALGKIIHGFGCEILLYDNKPNWEFAKSINAQYVSKEVILESSDIISLNVPLTKETHHLINKETLAIMKKGVMLINTGRGGLIDTKALIAALKTGHIGHAGLDVYEEEENIFFHDLSNTILNDDVLARLMTFPNVLITSHQAFLTQEALYGIARTTLQNIQDFLEKRETDNFLV